MRYYAFCVALAVFMAGCGEAHKEKSASEIVRDACQIELSCEPSRHLSLRQCEVDLKQTLRDTAGFSGACGRATEEFFACYSELSVCDGYDAFWLETPPASYPCRTEDLAQERACEGYSSTIEEPPKPIEAYCELEIACGYDEYSNVRECVADYEFWEEDAHHESAACGRAMTDYFTCLGKLANCAEFHDYWLSDARPYPCWAEDARLDEECEDL